MPPTHIYPRSLLPQFKFFIFYVFQYTATDPLIWHTPLRYRNSKYHSLSLTPGSDLLWQRNDCRFWWLKDVLVVLEFWLLEWLWVILIRIDAFLHRSSSGHKDDWVDFLDMQALLCQILPFLDLLQNRVQKGIVKWKMQLFNLTSKIMI